MMSASPNRHLYAPPRPGGRDGRAAPAPVNIIGVTARGACHDLALYGAYLNDTYLDGRSKAALRWGRQTRRRRSARTIRLGCYHVAENRILIHRHLDLAEVPRYFVEYILFHEMLHEVLGIGKRADGRREIHGRLFKLMEGTFPDTARALAFEKRYFQGIAPADPPPAPPANDREPDAWDAI